MMRGSWRIGLLGGTFAPIHIGHLDAADAPRRALALDEILVIEESRPMLEPQVKDILFDLAPAERPRVLGKRDGSGVSGSQPIAACAGPVAARPAVAGVEG